MYENTLRNRIENNAYDTTTEKSDIIVSEKNYRRYVKLIKIESF